MDSGLAAGTYFYRVTAEDAAGNVGPAGNEASGSATTDTTPPTAPTGLSATGTPGQVVLAWGAASDAGGIARYNVHRGTTAGFTPTTANRIAQPTTTSYTDTGLAGGTTYYYRVTAQDNAGNVGAPSNEANATVPTGPPPGLVAALGFDEGSGTTTSDRSGNGNNGTLANTAWSTTGKFGNALSFNGTNASVTVADSNSLDLTTGMTIEAWVQPAVGGGFRTVIVKERPGDLVYGLYSNSDTNRPQSQVTVGTPRLLDGTAAVPDSALDPSGCDLRRRDPASVRQRDAGLAARGRRIDPDLDLGAEDRREHDLARVVQRPDRRGARLQPRAERGPRSRRT